MKNIYMTVQLLISYLLKQMIYQCKEKYCSIFY